MTPTGCGRRALLGVATLALAAPPLIRARGEQPVRIGFVNSLSGILANLAEAEVQGARYAAAEINRQGGILGRQLDLLVEDSANAVGTGVEKALKLISGEKVSALIGDANSAVAAALGQVALEHKLPQIVAGAHADSLTGSDCKWNVFRVCNSITMDANALAPELIRRFGKRWFFVTPDYPYGKALQDAFVRVLKKAGGDFAADTVPVAATDFSASFAKATDYKPNVLINNMPGLAQAGCNAQFAQSPLAATAALGGALFELEAALAAAPAAQAGWWNMEWWWNQPAVPHVAAFNDGIRLMFKVPAASARHWFGYVAVHTLRLAAEAAGGLNGVKLARAIAGMTLPPEIALQPGPVVWREGDHQLLAGIFVGQVHPPRGGPAQLFTPVTVVPGAQAAGPVAESGCKITMPAS